jgi:hypothetical protein
MADEKERRRGGKREWSPMTEEFFMFTPEVAAEMEVTREAFSEVVCRVGDFRGCLQTIWQMKKKGSILSEI